MSDKQNAHFTYKGNVGVGRYGWLRLTPAYSVKLVRNAVATLPEGSIVTDPFSGTGTTPLAAAEHGIVGQSQDVNPFLVWLGNTKIRNYSNDELIVAREARGRIVKQALNVMQSEELWQPGLFNIQRWWSHSNLEALKALRYGLDQVPDEPFRDLLLVGFCRTLIKTSNAAFNHQSMSFKEAETPHVRQLFESHIAHKAIDLFTQETDAILKAAEINLPGRAKIIQADSRHMGADYLQPCDLLYTSPPYVNRMSYIRELRPYMYWLRFLDSSSDAGELDWKTIGGTWGIASSRLNTWASNEPMPIESEIDPICELIAKDGGKNGPLLAIYVRKYFVDVWEHFQSAYKHVKSGGQATYIVGNSSFYSHLVPAERWYALLLEHAGFEDVRITVIRKRNSKKELFEYDVTAKRP